MNILICHERFLFRFGADRVLILLGAGLKRLGHRVELLGNRYDSDVVAPFAERVIECPTDRSAYLDLNEFSAQWLRDNWSQLFLPGATPDVIIVGGWPFIAAISFFRQVCRQVIFVDFGVVPTMGYAEGTIVTLEKLRRLRRAHLPDATSIIGISRFIADSQSRPDAGPATSVSSVLLGADHMEMTLWKASQLTSANQQQQTLSNLRSLRAQGCQIILCLGRWEPGSYKNSQAALEVLERLIDLRQSCVLLVLEQASNVEIPASLKSSVLAIGFPDDQELIEIMKEVDLGLSVSLWEGFNLPLAEMQWLGKPALAFHLAAHPEVVLDPWFLCTDTQEMADKASALLGDAGPRTVDLEAKRRAFREYFTWDRFTNDYSRLLNSPGAEQDTKPKLSSLLFMDVSSATKDPSNPGVIRVTRRLGRELQNRGEDPIFVVWEHDKQRYVLPTEEESIVLGRFNGPVIHKGGRLSKSFQVRTTLEDIWDGNDNPRPWLFLPEVMMEKFFQGARRFARERKFRIAALFYDSIPVLRPDLCNEEIRTNHSQYMKGLAECDLVVPISHFSERCLKEFWRETGRKTGCQVVADVLPGEFGGAGRGRTLPELDSRSVSLLCVSTLEPRKNHRSLIQACLRMQQRHPELDWSLTLVGGRYHGAFDLAEWIQQVEAENPRIRWLGVVDDASLETLYRQSSFTIYPSVIEGFGLPIVESIWHGRPCLCHNQGVMAELAADGGCLTADVTNPADLSDAIYRLATNADLRLRLSQEAISRPLRSWQQYVEELTTSLVSLTSSTTAWQEALYPDCLCKNWQMNDSERMTLTGLLARQKPQCSIEIGTYHAGSLSLISQFSGMVFSIDIDESISSRFSFPNVSFLCGDSTVLLPLLLKELDKSGTPVEFILIDGDHSAAGVRRDIESLLNYVPRKPFFVVLHDSFNPECRRGMLEANWHRSPYCHWVDLDFVPGRVTEVPGPFQGELWGGLALGYFLPVPRSGNLQIARTAEGMFQLLAAKHSSQASA